MFFLCFFYTFHYFQKIDFQLAFSGEKKDQIKVVVMFHHLKQIMVSLSFF